jgi:hypothetical protein
MNKEERKKLLEDLAKLNYGRALTDLIEEELSKIDTVDGITSLEEAIGRKYAVKTLNTIFSFLEKRSPHNNTKKVNYT